MAKKESGCFYLIAGLIVLAIIMWVIKNIIGIASLALAAWAGYQLYKKYNAKQPFKLEAILLSIGLVVGIGWFALSSNTPKSADNTPPATTESQQTALQSAYQQQPAPSSDQVTAATSDSQETENVQQLNQNQNAPILLVAAKVTKVVDGDTIYIKLSNGSEEKVRFIGVDTPESTIQHEPYGQEASNYTKSKLSGKTVYLEKDVSERDKYNRLLRYVWLEKPGEISDTEIRSKMFNAILLLEGYAQVATYPPNVKYVDYFTKYQTEAREASKGLWGIEVTEAEPEPQPAPSQAVSTETFVGSANSNKYHYPDCRWAKKISAANLVEFSSAEEARKAGYVPCKVCSPP